MRIATWNINGIKARIENLVAWLNEAKPDVAMLQETKTVDEAFPREPIEALGYNIAAHGEKGFNGVALLSKRALQDVRFGLPGDGEDSQCRYVEAIVSSGDGVVRVASLYLPNGNPIGTPKFDYKLKWLNRLEAHAKDLLALEEPFVLGGDYNVIPEPIDAKRPETWVEDALFQPQSRRAFRRLLALGLTDAVRAAGHGEGTFTFWDYQAGAWNKNNGIRIDHLLMSPQAADRLITADVDRHTRGWERPSDHVPVRADLDLP